MARRGLNISWTVQGDRELADKLAELKNPRRFIRPALAKGATVLRQSIIGLIPPRTSHDDRHGQVNVSIRRSIGRRIRERGGMLQLSVGASIGTTHSKRLGLTRDQAVARLAYFMGTKWRQTKAGRSTGRIMRKDIIPRGGRAADARAHAVITADLTARIDKALATQRATSTVHLVTP